MQSRCQRNWIWAATSCVGSGVARGGRPNGPGPKLSVCGGRIVASYRAGRPGCHAMQLIPSTGLVRRLSIDARQRLGHHRRMHFDLKLWRMTAGLRGRIALSAAIGLLALSVGIARFAFLGRFLAGVFRGEDARHLMLPLLAAAGAILLRAWLDHHRAMIAQRSAARVQERLRGRLFDKIVALGPAWFGAERTGGVDAVDGRRRGAVAIVLRSVPAAGHHRRLRAVGDLRLHRLVGRAGCRVMLAAALVHPGPARHRASQTALASRARQAAFKSFGEEFLDAVQGLPTLKAFGQSAAYGANPRCPGAGAV